MGAEGAGLGTDIERGFAGDGELVDVVRLRRKCFMPLNVHVQDGESSGSARGNRTNTVRFMGHALGEVSIAVRRRCGHAPGMK